MITDVSSPQDAAWGTDASLREKCGVFGVRGAPDAAIITAAGLHALQHRGQEGCGIVSLRDGLFFHERHRGLVQSAFGRMDLADRLPGRSAIGHVRYGTQGRAAVRNIQPLYADLADGGFALAHNGNFTNARALRRELVKNGAIFQSDGDTEVMIHLVAQSGAPDFTERFADGLARIEGAYALVGMTGKKLVGARDPKGIRPLVVGRLPDGAPVLASETTALAMVGATFDRDVNPGEIVVFSDHDAWSRTVSPPPPRPRTCAFEYVYFARPDSVVDGVGVYAARKRMGVNLAREQAVPADVVVPVPDGGMPAAIGYAEASGLPLELGIVRSHFVGRTFIVPGQSSREAKVRQKHSINAAVVAGKRVVLVDDSIVRGTTSKLIASMMLQAGASEVHFRSASPPIRYPDFYGIDMATKDQLLAGMGATIAEMRDELAVTSLGFLSIDGFYDAVLGQARNPDAPQLSDHTFTGDYPTALVDHEAGESDKNHQMSYLEDVL